ncbi:MAG: FecR/PupR family sigma factor regulator, partial [Amphiplicatus sp.]
MGEPRRGVDGAVIDEATKWFALLRSDAATDEDRRAFETWRDADPRHAEAYEGTLSIWDDVGELGDLKDLVAAPEIGRGRPQSR